MKNNKENNLEVNKWHEYRQNLNFEIVKITDIESSLNKFNEEIMSQLSDNRYILIIFKIKTSEGLFRSISRMQRVSKSEFCDLHDIFIESWNIKNEEYHTWLMECIIFNYILLPSEEDTQTSKILKSKKEQKPAKKVYESMKMSGYNFPNTMDITQWGNVHFLQDYTEAIVYRSFSLAEYHVKIKEKCLLVDYQINSHSILTFTDTMDDVTNLGTFTREFENQTYNFVDGELILKRRINKLAKLRTLKEEVYHSNKFLTMDIETQRIDDKHKPYAVCLYDGKEKKSFYLSDYNDRDELLISSIKHIMKRKYEGYKVYFHNFSNFDGIFYIKVLTSLSDNIDPIIKDNDIINLLFKFSNKYCIYFRDSYLMFPSSLKELAKSFNVTNKSTFPYFFVNNPNISLEYIGPIPSFEYFNEKGYTLEEFGKEFSSKYDKIIKYLHDKEFTEEDIKNKFREEIKKSLGYKGPLPEEYKEYCDQYPDSYNNWNLREETIKYCLNDCVALYEIIEKFSKEIFELFRINVIKYPTLSALAFAIFRTKFMKSENIPLLTGAVYDYLKLGYTGGAVDVYKPYGKNVYRYDVNSLYPSTMLKKPMPVGNPTYFEGDITKVIPNAFGFFKVEVNTPQQLKHPILLTRINTGRGGTKTVAPLGHWIGVYSSIEINRCKELGYKFNILSGIAFETENIFKEYVEYFYNLKKNSTKDSPHYIIAKLLLNTLYGRFGMNPELEKHVIVDERKRYEYVEKYEVSDILELKNGKELISYSDHNDDLDYDRLSNVSIALAASVTAYARVHMSQFKNNDKYTLYYSDTDNVDIDKPLDSIHVGGELGQMKLEHIFEEATYLAPKVYGGIVKEDKFPEHELIKVKGLKNPISFQELKFLLNKDSKLEIGQEKWYRNISKGEITIKEEIYSLTISENKRKLVFDRDNIFIDTEPLQVNQIDENNEITIENKTNNK